MTQTPLARNSAGEMSGASVQPHERPVWGVTSLSLFLTFRKPLPASSPLTSVGEPAVHYMLQHEVRQVNTRDTSDKTSQSTDRHSPFSPWPWKAFTPVPCRAAQTSDIWDQAPGDRPLRGHRQGQLRFSLAVSPSKLLLWQDFILCCVLS